ncbi:GUN4 domain-containing protein [Oscillatoria sp. FACHB-1407]|uniref:GUN4 domain-containing protein n=1 Tax=Oscillatoria sp. FACHB-1407 TaxID=2692847 RepID=UPI00168249B3|nr:GUN4 domain-containing protein [Oscillatoria sp. FACHB-1407]MBD2464646.1 GUN4 domain-containing protein [Oscillatoria sp. FACHB-1407]
MARVALLIGVSEYGSGLRPLPAASNDVEALQQVLENQEIGDFDVVKPLINPSQSEMAEAIETWSSSHTSNDLVLLFFSGHRVYDEHHNLYFAARNTYKNKHNHLIKASAVSANFVRDCFEQSQSRQQVVILDWCSGESLSNERSGDRPVSGIAAPTSVEHQFGAAGRVVLLPSSDWHYSFVQKRSDRSLYTRYLVEGISTGVADRNFDGSVSADELHEYVRKRVKEAAPGIDPKIIRLNEQDLRIEIARVKINDPQRHYRQEVEKYASQGKISEVGRTILDTHRVRFGLSPIDAAVIEEEVLQPYRDYQSLLKQYRDAVAPIEQEYLLNEGIHEQLKTLQHYLGLRDEDVAPIQQEIAAKVEAYQRESKHRERLNHIQQYGEIYEAIARREYPLSSRTATELRELQEVLGLRDEDVAPIQAEIHSQLAAQEEAYRRKLQHYEYEFTQAVSLGLPISEFTRDGLRKFQHSLELRDDDVNRIEQQVMEQNKSDAEAYQEKLQHYEFKFSQEVNRELPLSEATREELKQFQQHLGLRDEDAAQVEHRVIGKIQEQEKAYQNKLSLYEQRFMQVVNLEYPPGEFARHELRNLQKSLGLREADVQQIERAASASRQAEFLAKQQEQKEQKEQQPKEVLEPPVTVIQTPAADASVAPPPQTSPASIAPVAPPAPPAPPTPPPAPAPVAAPSTSQLLPSERGISYTRLNELLQAKNWREADEETLALMLKATGREKAGWLDRTALESFPCVDLHTIDQLWLEHSGGRFGFSVQHRIYREIPKGDAALFGDRIGWWHPKMRIFLPYSSLKFNPQAPEGHLPAFWFWKIPVAESLRSWGLAPGRGGCATDSWMLATLMRRMENCPQ